MLLFILIISKGKSHRFLVTVLFFILLKIRFIETAKNSIIRLNLFIAKRYACATRIKNKNKKKAMLLI